jgi:exonuclease III
MDMRIGTWNVRSLYRAGSLMTVVLNVHAPTEDKFYDVKGSFYEEMERVFDKFKKYHMKILLEDFNANVGREDIFKPTIEN